LTSHPKLAETSDVRVGQYGNSRFSKHHVAAVKIAQ